MEAVANPNCIPRLEVKAWIQIVLLQNAQAWWNSLNVVSLFSSFQTFLRSFFFQSFFISFSLFSSFSLFAFFSSLYFLSLFSSSTFLILTLSFFLSCHQFLPLVYFLFFVYFFPYFLPSYLVRFVCKMNLKSAIDSV